LLLTLLFSTIFWYNSQAEQGENLTTTKILIVDDEQQMRLALGETLRRAGYDTSEAGTPSEALTLFRRGGYDMVVSDIRMPGMSGIELLSKLKAADPEVPVVMITAYGTIEDAVEAMKRGAADYLLKPFSPEYLEGVVARVLGSHSEPEDERYRIVTEDPHMKKLMVFLKRAAATEATILIQAESGTGKELFARRIHADSPRSAKSFVAVNCAAVPENLLESELFGYEKGAFTGASTSKEGKFELADGGSLLLDEISEMSNLLQAKLLRVLQEKEIDKVGGRKPIPVDVRVIASTNTDLAERVRSGVFREDLFYRLNVVPITIPPLRERPGDIPVLAEYFIQRYGIGGRIKLAKETLEALLAYRWPGNVRELENAIQRAVIICSGVKEEIEPEDIFFPSAAKGPTPGGLQHGGTVREMEKELILATLKRTGGNRTAAAKLLGVSLRTLRNKLNEYRAEGIEIE
jgi:DNA-binding NtrC family response regulator